nr:family 20 glycosylhydrolase [Lelliottia steviae]
MNKVILLVITGLLLLTHSAQSATQTELNRLAESLQVNYQLVDANPVNCPEPHEKQCYLSALTFTSSTDIDPQQWHIYFSQLMPVYKVDSKWFDIEHINGDIHRISAKQAFKDMPANTTFAVQFYSQESQITRSEFLPNFILAAPGLDSKVIASTKTSVDNETQLELQPYLQPFTTDAQLQVSDDDETPWMGANYLYDSYTKPTFKTAPLGLIPSPIKLEQLSSSRIDLSKGINVVAIKSHYIALIPALERLAKLGVPQSKEGIVINVSQQLTSQLPDAYELTLRHNAITINANNTRGAFYALQSLAALISLDDLTLPELKVTDGARYEYRGMHIDVARNFRSKAFILNTIEQMAAYKLNKLHLHLADDEGWRLQIAGLPELTSVGANRCFDLTEQTCLLPQLGAGINANSGINGYFSRADYIEILQHAKKHFVEVIPSFDMPGHSRAAIVAMEARFNHFMALNKPALAKQYRLTEPEDTTAYSSIQHYKDNTLNVCLDTTYDFIDKILDEVITLHKEAGVPLNTYHIGADETAGAWLQSPSCIALQQKTKIHSFNGYFIERIAKLVADKGLNVAGWSDGLSDVNVNNMPSNVYSYAWATLSDEGHKVAHNHINNGWKVVVTSPDVTYFDFPYQSHPQERGNHWASRAIDSKKVFSFMPDNLPAHAQIWRSVKHQTYVADDSQSARTADAYGIQGHLWSELLRSDQQAEYMMYPRLFALAERAWHKAEWELDYKNEGAIYSHKTQQFTLAMQQQKEQDWQHFAALVGFKELAKLEQAGRFYRIPTVAAKKTDSGIDAFVPYPNIAVEYQDKLGNWHRYDSHNKPLQAVKVRAKSINNERAGRALKLTN